MPKEMEENLERTFEKRWKNRFFRAKMMKKYGSKEDAKGAYVYRTMQKKTSWRKGKG